jgi:hypothetical protein
MTQEKRKEMVIQNTISSWEDAKNGKYNLINNHAIGKSAKYCEEQIQYFKKLKL